MSTATPILHKLVAHGSKPFTEPQQVFMHMIRLAQPIMTAYQCDLYHDAMFLKEHASLIAPHKALVFYWDVAPSHTWIGLEPHNLTYRDTDDLHFRLTVWLAGNGWWTLTVEGLTD